jgi:hypothetical protein
MPALGDVCQLWKEPSNIENSYGQHGNRMTAVDTVRHLLQNETTTMTAVENVCQLCAECDSDEHMMTAAAISRL